MAAALPACNLRSCRPSQASEPGALIFGTGWRLFRLLGAPVGIDGGQLAVLVVWALAGLCAAAVTTRHEAGRLPNDGAGRGLLRWRRPQENGSAVGGRDPSRRGGRTTTDRPRQWPG